MDWRKSRGYYVYGLSDPRDGKIFYVGKGIRQRCLKHVAEYRAGVVANAEKFNRIGEILSAGLTVEIVTLAVDLPESVAFAIEREKIQEFGPDNLTNAKPGQTSELEKAAAAAKYWLERLMPFDVWRETRSAEYLAKFSEQRMREIYDTVESGFREVINSWDALHAA